MCIAFRGSWLKVQQLAAQHTTRFSPRVLVPSAPFGLETNAEITSNLKLVQDVYSYIEVKIEEELHPKV
jgi:hypothetical protein